MTKKQLSDRFLDWSSWHHTSSKYNKIDFYRIDEDKIIGMNQEYLTYLIKIPEQFKITIEIFLNTNLKMTRTYMFSNRMKAVEWLDDCNYKMIIKNSQYTKYIGGWHHVAYIVGIK